MSKVDSTAFKPYHVASLKSRESSKFLIQQLKPREEVFYVVTQKGRVSSNHPTRAEGAKFETSWREYYSGEDLLSGHWRSRWMTIMCSRRNRSVLWWVWRRYINWVERGLVRRIKGWWSKRLFDREKDRSVREESKEAHKKCLLSLLTASSCCTPLLTLIPLRLTVSLFDYLEEWFRP